jgi:hypothetical protein
MLKTRSSADQEHPAGAQHPERVALEVILQCSFETTRATPLAAQARVNPQLIAALNLWLDDTTGAIA